MILTTGYPHSLEVQAVKAWAPKQKISFCKTWDEIAKQLAKERFGLLPMWNSQFGHNLQCYRFLDEHGLKIVDEVAYEPQFCVAAQSDDFEVVTAPSELLNLTNGHWRKNRSYLLKQSNGSLEALERSKQFPQFATVCTSAEAKAYKLAYCQPIKHGGVKQVFAVIGKNLNKQKYKRTKMVLTIDSYTQQTLSLLCHAFKKGDVLIDDLFFLPFSVEQRKLIVSFVDDYRLARVRKICNQISDLELGKIEMIGGGTR